MSQNDSTTSTKPTVEQLQAEIAQLKAQLALAAAQMGCNAKIGEKVMVINTPSWEGWEGTLVAINGSKAEIAIDHKKSGRKTYSTLLCNVRKYVAPKAKEKAPA